MAVQVIDPPAALYGIAAGMAEMLESARAAAKAGLADAVAAAAGRHPDVEVTTKVVLGSPGGVLAAESDGAAMLVVGSRGRSGLASMVLGSTSHAVLHHAHCPVVVCPVGD